MEAPPLSRCQAAAAGGLLDGRELSFQEEGLGFRVEGLGITHRLHYRSFFVVCI